MRWQQSVYAWYLIDTKGSYARFDPTDKHVVLYIPHAILINYREIELTDEEIRADAAYIVEEMIAQWSGCKAT
jgi:hypothetical protein